MTQFLETETGRRIAYNQTPGKGPGVVFLGGFMSDMEGTKATHLQAWARAQGRAFLRFDYSGHGQSEGELMQGSISDWAEDAIAAIEDLTQGPQIIVGSSMGGWIALIVAREIPEKVCGLVGIAAAPDFIRWMYDDMDDEQRNRLYKEGRGLTPDTDPSGYLEVWARLIFDEEAIVMDEPLPLPFPTRLLQGTADRDVPYTTAIELMNHATGDDIRVTLVKDADHRFSTPPLLALIEASIAEVLQSAGPST